MKKRLLIASFLLLVVISTCFLTACNQGKETTLQFVYADGEESPQGDSPRLVIDCRKVCDVTVYLGGFSSQIPALHDKDKIQAYCKDVLTGFVVTDDETYCNEFAASLSEFEKFDPPCGIQLILENNEHIRFFVYDNGMFIYIDVNGKGYVCTADSPKIDVNKLKYPPHDDSLDFIYAFDSEFDFDFSK